MYFFIPICGFSFFSISLLCSFVSYSSSWIITMFSPSLLGYLRLLFLHFLFLSVLFNSSILFFILSLIYFSFASHSLFLNFHANLTFTCPPVSSYIFFILSISFSFSFFLFSHSYIIFSFVSHSFFSNFHVFLTLFICSSYHLNFLSFLFFVILSFSFLLLSLITFHSFHIPSS